MSENRIEEILKNFDEHFKTSMNDRIKNKSIIMRIFDEFLREIYEVDDAYKIALETKEQVVKELQLNEKQQELFEKWEECENEILDNRVERAFIYGFSISDEEREESKKEYEK